MNESRPVKDVIESVSEVWPLQRNAAIASWKSDSDSVIISSESNGHFYVCAFRADSHFDSMPEKPSFPFIAGKRYSFQVNNEFTKGLQFQYIIIEYTESGRRQAVFNDKDISHEFLPDVLTFTFALRIKGPGQSTLRSVEVKEEYPLDSLTERFEVSGASTCRFIISSWSPDADADRSALAVISFRDKSGHIVLPMDDNSMHPALGAYRYLNIGSSDEPGTTEIVAQVPDSAVSVQIEGVPWNRSKRVYIDGIQRLELESPSDSGPAIHTESIESFVSSIPVADKLIVMHTTAPHLGHPSLLLRPNRLTREYAALGYWIVFFPFSKVPVGESVQGERVRQYSRDDVHRFLTAAGKRRGRNNIYICSSFPDLAAVTTIDKLKMSGWTTVYEVRDDMEEFNRVGYSKWFDPQLERHVASAVNSIVTVSPRLAQKMDIISGKPMFSRVVANGVSTELIAAGAGNRSTVAFVRRSESIKVGYIGHLTSSWFDWRLVIEAARSRPDVSFEIIGHGMPSNLVLPANIQFLGPKSHAEFVDIAMNWKVGLIPFKPSTLTFAVDPNKIYEYLAVGLRVVTAQMGAVAECPSTYVYKKNDDFLDKLDAALSGDFGHDEQMAISLFLEKCSWAARAQTMLSIMESE